MQGVDAEELEHLCHFDEAGHKAVKHQHYDAEGDAQSR